MVRKLDPADAELKKEVEAILESAEAVAFELAAQADAAGAAVHALRHMLDASTEDEMRTHGDALWGVVSTCAINGWYEISEPIGDFAAATRDFGATPRE